MSRYLKTARGQGEGYRAGLTPHRQALTYDMVPAARHWINCRAARLNGRASKELTWDSRRSNANRPRR
jgi:hypothetical protein